VSKGVFWCPKIVISGFKQFLVGLLPALHVYDIISNSPLLLMKQDNSNKKPRYHTGMQYCMSQLT
jgi:hypothetical protein